MPEEIQVNVAGSNQEGHYNYTFPVKIEKARLPKPYIGGYRNKLDGDIEIKLFFKLLLSVQT